MKPPAATNTQVTPEMSDETLKNLKMQITNDGDVDRLGFSCLGKIDDVYPEFPEEIRENWYRTWIWENNKGERIATWDEGNTWCHYLSDGSFLELSTFIYGEIEKEKEKKEITVKVTLRSNTSGRIIQSSYTPLQLLEDFCDKEDLMIAMSQCECQPVGETNFVECNCDEEWEDSTLTM